MYHFGYFTGCLLVLLPFLIASALDIMSTRMALANGATESNPLAFSHGKISWVRVAGLKLLFVAMILFFTLKVSGDIGGMVSLIGAVLTLVPAYLNWKNSR